MDADADTHSQEAEAAFKPLLAEAKEISLQMEASERAVEEQLAALEKQPALESLTVDGMLRENPAIAELVNKDIKSGNWQLE